MPDHGKQRQGWGLNAGFIAPGKNADLVIADATNGSTRSDLFSAMENGDVPGVGMVIIDGVIRVIRSRNTSPPQRMPRVVKQPAPELPR